MKKVVLISSPPLLILMVRGCVEESLPECILNRVAYRAPKSRATAPPARATGMLPPKLAAAPVWVGSVEGATVVAAAVVLETRVLLATGVLVWKSADDEVGVAVGVMALTRTRVLVMVVVKVDV